MNTCRVRGCRFSSTHTTRGHICGTCGGMGHGVMECGTSIRMDNLKKYFGEKLPSHKYCSGEHADPYDRFFHSNECHICMRCGERHLETNCNIQTVPELGDRFREYHENLDYAEMINRAQTQNRDQIYKVYVGMGCLLYFKVKINAITPYDTLVFFMHSDSWGQYGEETSDVPSLERFIGDSEINEDIDDQNDGLVGFDNSNGDDNNDNTKKCPLCRKENRIEDVKKIYGSSDTCSICYEKNVEHFFSLCGHACICDSCFQHL